MSGTRKTAERTCYVFKADLSVYYHPIITTDTVMLLVGTSVQVNFKVPLPCSVQNTSDSAHISADALLAGDTITLFAVATPETCTVCALLLHADAVSATVLAIDLSALFAVCSAIIVSIRLHTTRSPQTELLRN